MSAPVFELDDDTDPTLALEQLEQQDQQPQGDEAPEVVGDGGEETAPEQHGGDNSRNLTLALKQERERRKAAEQQAAQYREQHIRFEERAAAFQAQQAAERQRQQAEEAARLQAAKQAEDPEPNQVEDPDGWREWKIRDLERNQRAMQQTWEEQRQQQAQFEQQRVIRERWQRLESDVNRSEIEFRSERPDYREALDHVIAVRFHRWRAARPGITDDQVWALLNQERMQLLDQCVAGVRPDGVIEWSRNPAAALYDVALAEGYVQPERRQPQQVEQQPQQPVTRAPSPRMQNLQAGVAAAQRQTTGGRPGDGGGRMTIEKLNAMSEAEFYSYAQQYPGIVEELMS